MQQQGRFSFPRGCPAREPCRWKINYPPKKSVNVFPLSPALWCIIRYTVVDLMFFGRVISIDYKMSLIPNLAVKLTRFPLGAFYAGRWCDKTTFWAVFFLQTALFVGRDDATRPENLLSRRFGRERGETADQNLRAGCIRWTSPARNRANFKDHIGGRNAKHDTNSSNTTFTYI